MKLLQVNVWQVCVKTKTCDIQASGCVCSIGDDCPPPLYLETLLSMIHHAEQLHMLTT